MVPASVREDLEQEKLAFESCKGAHSRWSSYTVGWAGPWLLCQKLVELVMHHRSDNAPRLCCTGASDASSGGGAPNLRLRPAGALVRRCVERIRLVRYWLNLELYAAVYLTSLRG